MATRSGWTDRARSDPVVVDFAVALTLLAGVVIQVGTGEAGDAAAFLLLAPAVTLPLGWRRRAPLVSAFLVALAVTAQSLVTAPLPAFGEFLAVMLAAYSVAAHAHLRVAVLGLVAVAAAVSVQGLRDPTATSSFEFVYGVVYFGGAWVIGRVARSHRQRTAGLVQRADLLEREREAQAKEAVAAERARIARELHDVIAHCVSVIVIQAGAAEEVVEREPARAREALRSIRAVGNDALAEMRRLLGVLRDVDDELALEPQPGLARLDELVRHAAESGVSVDVDVEGPPRLLPPGVDLAAYRVVQEALTNVRKHAATSHARVGIRYCADGIRLEITDDGAGGTAASTDGSGHGIIGMRERVALYGGQVSAGLRSGGGFVVRVWLPLPADAPSDQVL